MELGGYVITNIEFFYLVIKNMTLIVSNDTIETVFHFRNKQSVFVLWKGIDKYENI